MTAEARHSLRSWLQSLMVAAFVAGGSWATLGQRVEVLSQSLSRIERQLSDIQIRVRGLENQVAVISAIQPKLRAMR